MSEAGLESIRDKDGFIKTASIKNHEEPCALRDFLFMNERFFDAFPEWERAETGEADFFSGHPTLNGFDLFMEQKQVVNGYVEIHFIHRLQ